MNTCLKWPLQKRFIGADTVEAAGIFTSYLLAPPEGRAWVVTNLLFAVPVVASGLMTADIVPGYSTGSPAFGHEMRIFTASLDYFAGFNVIGGGSFYRDVAGVSLIIQPAKPQLLVWPDALRLRAIALTGGSSAVQIRAWVVDVEPSVDVSSILR